MSSYLDTDGNFIGEPPTTWEVVTIDLDAPLSDDAACAIALAGCLAAGFTNAHARMTLDSMTTDAPATRADARPYH